MDSSSDDEKWEVPTFARHRKPPPGTESIGYDLYESPQYMNHLKQFGRLSGMDVCNNIGFRWILLGMVGLVTGLVAVAVDVSIDYLFEFRMHINDVVVDAGWSIGCQYLAFVGVALCSVSVAAYLVCYVEVLAAGSGIPEIKCFLNGIDFPNVVGLKTLCAKAIGIVFSVTAGLPCGKEGPMIHSGAITGALVTRCDILHTINPVVIQQETRDFVAAGAAAGVAAAFGAPLGGVLFAVEEGASHMDPSIMTRLFVACATGALASRFFIGPILGGIPWGHLGSAVPVSFGKFHHMEWDILEMPIFAMMGVAGGLFGALFNAVNQRLSEWRIRHIGPRGRRRFFEVLLVTLVVSSLQFLVPAVSVASKEFSLSEEGVGSLPSQLHLRSLSESEESQLPLRRHLKLEELSLSESLFWQKNTAALKSLFHSEEEFNLWYVLLFFVMNLSLSCLTYGIGVPSGLFVPALLTGAAFGRIVGQLLHSYVFPISEGQLFAATGLYSLIGASAMLAGTARITISLAMILMEVTGNAEFGLPIFLVVMLAKWTGDVFNRGIYDLHIIDLKKVPLLEAKPETNMIGIFGFVYVV
ncbi:unnamed protein product, partial [Polarella glacialis]